MSDITITIIDRKNFKPWLANSITVFMCFVAPVAMGIAFKSDAMQWVGFVLGFILMMAVAVKVGKDGNKMTIPEARKYLDKMEAGE